MKELPSDPPAAAAPEWPERRGDSRGRDQIFLTSLPTSQEGDSGDDLAGPARQSAIQ